MVPRAPSHASRETPSVMSRVKPSREGRGGKGGQILVVEMQALSPKPREGPESHRWAPAYHSIHL